MKCKIIFRMVAYTDAAGKSTIGAPRSGNEDNFYFLYDVSSGSTKGKPDVDMQMSAYGLLMVVADGMGGMNAGEVASQIAVNTVEEYFAQGKISLDTAASADKRRKYLEQVIIEADERIKKDSKQNKEHEGMGSTIILAWIVGKELTLSWCGDSRAYRYNPATGIELLSKDHSYVQELVDKGLIRYEDTFDHPQGNIVTRSLGDMSRKAQPESRQYEVYDNDIIMLCSDGLSGVLRDRKTYDMDGDLIAGDNLEDIIAENHSSLTECREALWDAAANADWYDNVTAVLCEIRSGAGVMPVKQQGMPVNNDSNVKKGCFDGEKHISIKITRKGLIKTAISAVVLVCLMIYLSLAGIRGKIIPWGASGDTTVVEADTTQKDTTIYQGYDKESLLSRIERARSMLSTPDDSYFFTKVHEEFFNRLKQEVGDTTVIQPIRENVKKVVLLEKKIPYLQRIKDGMPSRDKERRPYEELYQSILFSENFEAEEWNRALSGLSVSGVESGRDEGVHSGLSLQPDDVEAESGGFAGGGELTPVHEDKVPDSMKGKKLEDSAKETKK